MNKNFKEKQREIILMKLVNRYESKIIERENYIKELEQKKKFKDDLVYGIKINNMYWKCVMGIFAIIFPIIGYCAGNIIRGLSMAIVSNVAIVTTLLLSNIVKNYSLNISNSLANQIEKSKLDNEEHQKDLDKLKKHITPAHIEYNIKPNNTIEVKPESYVKNCFMEDYTFEEEVVDNSIEGPTLVKKIKR